MDLQKSILARPSYYYAVGFFTVLLSLPLLYTVKTPLYAQVSGLFQATPLSAVLAASPGVFILGILINQARVVIKKFIFKIPVYKAHQLPDASRAAATQSISEVLHISPETVDLRTDRHFEEAKLLVIPLFDPYSIASRWINDFLECAILVSAFSLFIVGFRAIGYSFEGIEFTVMEISLVLIVVGSVSLVGLPKKYTVAETSVLLREWRQKTGVGI